jgi:hypothetical protein
LRLCGFAALREISTESENRPLLSLFSNLVHNSRPPALAKLPHSLEGKQVEHEFALQEDHTARVLRTTLGEDHYGDFVDANEAADSVVSMIEENRVRLSGLLSMAEHEQLDQLRNCADASLLALLIDLNEFDKMNVSLARRLAELAKEYAEQAFWLLHKKLKPDYKPDLVLTEPLVTSGPELTEVYESSDWTISRRRSSKS